MAVDDASSNNVAIKADIEALRAQIERRTHQMVMRLIAAMVIIAVLAVGITAAVVAFLT
jgi:hypothetical protein